VAILGPRQVGKTTLARQIRANAAHAPVHLDLANAFPRAKKARVRIEIILAIMEYYSIITSMIPRRLASQIRQCLTEFPAVGLIGPRQVGKSTLARSIAQEVAGTGNRPDYLDLESPADQAKLEDAGAYLKARADRLIVIDEVQRAPGLFKVLRGVIDENTRAGRDAGQFLLLGSASIELLKQSSESLAGRIVYLELAPIDVTEVPPAQAEALWVRGGFPRSLLAKSDEASANWREAFITTYLERDIPQLGPRIPATTLRRFWTMLAHRQGAPLNAAELARALAVDGKTVASYLDLMVDLLLVRRLQPLHANVGKRLTKSPKVYVRDSGLVHSLLRLDTLDDVLGHPVAGESWEGHAIETLIGAAPPRTQASFYRTATGVELDLVLDFAGGERWAIEIKRSSAPKLEKGFRTAIEDVRPSRAFVVYGGHERYPKGEGTEAISLRGLAEELDGQTAKHARGK
jgi:predicted AAA+ superfamily ATPase